MAISARLSLLCAKKRPKNIRWTRNSKLCLPASWCLRHSPALCLYLYIVPVMLVMSPGCMSSATTGYPLHDLLWTCHQEDYALLGMPDAVVHQPTEGRSSLQLPPEEPRLNARSSSLAQSFSYSSMWRQDFRPPC